MHAVEIAMPQRPDAWCGSLKRLRPGMNIQVDAIFSLSDDTMVEVVTLAGEGAVESLEALRAKLGEERIQVLYVRPTRVQMRLVVPVCPIARLIHETGLTPRMPIPVEDGWDHWVVVGQKTALKKVIRDPQGPDSSNHNAPYQARVVRSGMSQPARPLLTPHQKRILSLAVEEGYYDTPRRTTIRGLAAKAGLSKSTVSETLLTVERKVIHGYQAHGLARGQK